MTPSEVIKIISENTGGKVIVTPLGHLESELILVRSTDTEGFTYEILADPLCDPQITHWWPFDEITDVRPAK
jgi:hypothetical protein